MAIVDTFFRSLMHFIPILTDKKVILMMKIIIMIVSNTTSFGLHSKAYKLSSKMFVEQGFFRFY